MSELSDVIGGNTVTAAFTNEVKERTLMRYATAAARDTSIPAPIAGSQAWLEDSDTVTLYDGAAWFDARYDDAEAVAAIPHRIIATRQFASLKVASGQVLDSFSLPNESGNCHISVAGPCGFDTADRDVAFNITGTGVTLDISDRVLAVNAKWATAMGFATSTLAGQTISILSDSDGSAFYRGSVVVTKI